MEYEIHTECRECDGYGIREHLIAADETKDSDCAECDGSGLVMHTEVYDSEADAKADYPESFLRPSKWNRAKAIQRGEMIANRILGPTLGFRS
jgi:hypothetical protein